MNLSTAWVFFAALTFAIVGLVVVFAASSQRRGSGRSRERAERETGRALEPQHRDRPQNQTRTGAFNSQRDGPS